jgi:hypothetical protein
MEILANIIAFLHLLFVIFVVVTPFVTNDTLILLFYCFIVFSVMFHWITNNHGCVLTLIESKLRNKQPTQTFMGRLISPVYKISRLEVRLITLALFLYAFYKSDIWNPDTFYKTINLFSFQFKIFMNTFNGEHQTPRALPTRLETPAPMMPSEQMLQEVAGDKHFQPVPV